MADLFTSQRPATSFKPTTTMTTVTSTGRTAVPSCYLRGTSKEGMISLESPGLRTCGVTRGRVHAWNKKKKSNWESKSSGEWFLPHSDYLFICPKPQHVSLWQAFKWKLVSWGAVKVWGLSMVVSGKIEDWVLFYTFCKRSEVFDQ
jgi:hypothetical protein